MDVSYVPAPQYDGRSGCLQVYPPQSPLVSLFWYGKGAINPLTCRSWSDVEDYHIKFNQLFVVFVTFGLYTLKFLSPGVLVYRTLHIADIGEVMLKKSYVFSFYHHSTSVAY